MRQSLLSRRLVGVGLALLCFEILLRFLAHGSPVLQPNRGWVYRNTTVRHLLTEGHGVSHWDDSGIRVSPFRPSAASTRVLALGDSMTEALQVSDAEVYTARLELALQRNGWQVAVLDAGRSSLSVADYIAAARSYQGEFHPSWTVVQLRLDDLTTDCRIPTRTHFVDGSSPLEVTVVSPRFGRLSSLLIQFRHSSALVDQTIGRATVLNATARLPPLFRGGDAPMSTAGVTAAPAYPIEEELGMLAAAWDGRLTIALIPDHSPTAGTIEERSIAYCHQQGISIVDLRSAFLQFDHERASPFGFSNSAYGVGHLNAEGHGALALLLADELNSLRARGLL
jgi:hypothetical protein